MDKLIDFFSLEYWKKGQRGLLKTKTENQGSQHSENGPCNSQRLEASNLHVSLLIHSTKELGGPKIEKMPCDFRNLTLTV